jgi:superfamily II DNA or RNA helicase
LPIADPTDVDPTEIDGKFNPEPAAMLQVLPPGTRVLVRGERWLVVGATPWPDCVVNRLVGIAPSNQLEERTLLAPFDRFEPLARASCPVHVSRRAWIAALAAAIRSTRPVDGLQAAHSAGIDLLPWQLEPALALVRGAASRILVADAVGLGKTIQALTALEELAARGEAVRVLIVTPAGLRDQWAGELETRFKRRVSVVDSALLATSVRELPPGVNPWSLPATYVVSFDYLKRPEVLHGIEGLCWDLLIADEAHLAAPSTDRHAALSRAAERAARVILLTATPYASDREGYDALCRIGRLQGPASGAADELLVFRRTRAAAGDTVRIRRTRIVRIALRADERRLHKVLDSYTARVWRESSTNASGRLAMIVLRKRSLSSAWSLRRTIERRLALLAQHPGEPDLQECLPFETPDDAEGDGTSEDCVADAVIGAPGLADRTAEVGSLTSIHRLAAAVADTQESKIRSLRRLLARTAEPAIVFTEYRDTLEHLSVCLGPVRSHSVLHGGLSRHERKVALANFGSGGASLLLATDAASEGLNLHQRCRWVINFEMPWNPARLEQRAGRVDRYGQRRTPHVVHLVARHTAESVVLARLEQRVRRARQAGWLDSVWPADDLVSAAIVGHDRLPSVRRAPGESSSACPLAARACIEAVTKRRLRAGSIRPEDGNTLSILELPRHRVAKRRSALDRLVAASGTVHVFDITVTDGAGRTADSTLMTILGSVSGADVMRGREAHVRDFRARVVARLTSRWRAIQEAASQRSAAFQPALFDRRALEEAQAGAAARDLVEQEIRSRLDRLEESRTVMTDSPRLLLVARVRAS